jgi:hypothetical protein
LPGTTALRALSAVYGNFGEAASEQLGDVDQPEEELPDELPEEVAELIERVDLLRNAVADLRLNMQDPVTAKRELSNVREELEQVTTALAITYGS